MKYPVFLMFMIKAMILLYACSGNSSATAAQEEEHAHTTPAAQKESKKPLSPRTTAMANIGDVHVHIDYSSPGVRGRTIWGGLVPRELNNEIIKTELVC